MRHEIIFPAQKERRNEMVPTVILLVIGFSILIIEKLGRDLRRMNQRARHAQNALQHIIRTVFVEKAVADLDAIRLGDLCLVRHENIFAGRASQVYSYHVRIETRTGRPIVQIGFNLFQRPQIMVQRGYYNENDPDPIKTFAIFEGEAALNLAKKWVKAYDPKSMTRSLPTIS